MIIAFVLRYGLKDLITQQAVLILFIKWSMCGFQESVYQLLDSMLQ